MTRDPLEDLYNKALRCARATGHADIAEDFAGWAVGQWIRGKSNKQTMSQMLKDYRRMTTRMGDTGAAGDAMRRLALSAEDTPSGTFPSPDATDQFEHLLETHYPTRTSRTCAVLYYKWGLTLKEIGHVVGIQEASVSSILRKPAFGKIRPDANDND